MTSASGARSAASDPFAEDWVRRPPSRRSLRNDALLAGALVVGAHVSASLSSVLGAVEHSASMWVIAIWSLCLPLPLALRRRFPAAVTGAVAIVYFAGAALHVPEAIVSQICLFIAFYTAGAWGRHRGRSIAVRAVVMVGMLTWVMYSIVTVDWMGSIVPSTDGDGDAMSPYAAYSVLVLGLNLLYFGAAWFFGETSRRSARHLEALEARTAELDDERERSARQAVSLERVRIARELHDVVAHHVSVMGVQAGAARRVLDRDPDQARRSLSAIEENARSAIDELHRMLVALRSDDVPEPPRPIDADRLDDCCGPDPGTAADDASILGLDRLDDLVATTHAVGMSVAFRTVGSPRPVPATIGLTLYRVAQEALTNVRKHAGPGAEVDMRVRYLADAVELEVSDHGGSRVPKPESDGAGRGLGQVGMRERVAAVGGSVELGPSTRGGYLVRARVPLPAAPLASAPAVPDRVDAPAAR